MSDSFEAAGLDTSPVGGAHVLEFPAGIALGTVQGDQTFMLMASDARRGLIRYAPWGASPRSDTRRVFIVADQRFGPVRLYAHVLGPPEGEDADTCVVVQWVMVTATERREHLARALEGILAVRASVTDSDEPLGPHRKLIYDAVTQQVRLIWVEQSDQPSSSSRSGTRPDRVAHSPRRGQRLMTAEETRKPTPGGPHPPGGSTRSHPRILVQLGEPGGKNERLRPRGQREGEPDPRGRGFDEASDSYRRGQTGRSGRLTPRTGREATVSDPGIVLTDVGRRLRGKPGTPTPVGSFAFSRSLGGRSGRREPLCPRDEMPGRLRVDHGADGLGPSVALTFGWIGAATCVFFVDSGQAPELGATVQVGVPGAPLRDDLIWVIGTVALLTVDRSGGQSMVEVSLHEATRPPQYQALVRYWMKRQGL